MAQPASSSFYNKTSAARKIIVVDLGFIGDSVHLIPALWAIKKNYPRAELHVLAAPAGREVIELARCVDRAWAFPLAPKSPPWWRHWGIIAQLRRERFDLAGDGVEERHEQRRRDRLAANQQPPSSTSRRTRRRHSGAPTA